MSEATTPAPAPLARFVLPSLLGALVFLVPVVVDGAVTIPFSLVTDAITGVIAPIHELLLLVVLVVGAAGALLWPLLARTPLGAHPTLRLWYDVHWVWRALRTVGAVFATMVVLETGPEFLIGPDTGGTVFRDICMAVLVIYFASAFFMGLLTDYGLMEFVGELLRAPFRRLFRLPGRAAVDSVASFVSAAGVGLLITVRQYEMGTYTAREACVICCSFSIVSLPFALLVARVSGVDALFVPWYLTIVLACLLAAMMVARIGPLARKPETRYTDRPRIEVDPEQGGALARGVAAARLRAATADAPGPYLRSAVVAFVDYAGGLLGPLMTIGTLASVLVFRTPVFEWLALPLVWVLELFSFPEADVAAKGFIVGALDQFMPALVAADVDSSFTRFVLAGLSVSQLVYLSEYGMILLRSALPITLPDLLLTFALRTVVVTPVLLAGAFLFT